MPRKEAALFQRAAVPDDEMRFYLSSFASSDIPAVEPLIIDDLADACALADAWLAEAAGLHPTVVSAIWFNDHWIPVMFTQTQYQIHLNTTLEGLELMPILFPTTRSTELQAHGIGEVQQEFFHDCGFQVFRWLIDQTRKREVGSASIQDAQKWRFLFWQKTLSTPAQEVENIRFLGGQNELETAIAAILKEHGVFGPRVADRAKQVIQQIGAQPLTAALRSTRPWTAIKELANQQNPKLRLIQEDEFNQVVQARTKKDQTFSYKKKQFAPKRAVSKAFFTANDISIPEGVFCQGDGTAIAQIQLRQVNPNARGIVVVSEQEVQPFLTQKQVSKDSLAFLVLSPYSEELANYGQITRFPAQCVATGEPVLLTAILIQKGALEVCRVAPKVPMQVDTVPAQTVKILVYRDQAGCNWDEITDRPVKYILDQFPAMRVCKKANCNCSSWHPDHEEGSEPILDIWQRDFLTIHFKKTRPTDSAIFTVMMRVSTHIFHMLSDNSGSQGIYLQARSPDGRAQDEKYHTVWLPKFTIDAARATQATADTATSLVRVTHRYGLRIVTEKAKTLHDSVRPEVPFSGGTARSTWIIGPVPYGTTRKGLVKLFQTWNWSAKPLQSIGPSADRSGLRWQVVADSPPENFVYTLAHGDVLIVKSEAQEERAVAAGQVEASSMTCKAIASQAMMQDPCAEAAAKLPKRNTPGISSAQIASLESSLEQRLLKKLHSADFDAEMQTDVEPRLAALEAQVGQIQQGQQAIAQKHQALESRVEQFGTQLEGQTKKLQNHLEDKLADQIQRIEALFAKRPRQE